MSGTIEQKMLQAIMFVFETSGTAISGLFDYCVFKKCKVDDLEGFLNKFEFKHRLFHLYNNDVTCCKCDTRFQGRNQVLKKVDFETLYKYVGRSHPHITRNEKGTITQVCICDFEAKPGITLNDLGVTLMAKILRNSCMKLVHPAALTGVDEIKERRKRICHAGRLDSLKDGDVDKMLQELETYVLQVIQHIQHKSFQTSIKTQIRLLKSLTIQHEEALIIIKQTECIVAAHDLSLIPPDFNYNFFVAHSQKDAEWVKNVLLYELEHKSPEDDFVLKGCIADRDFQPGKSIIQNIQDAITKSHKIILVLTRNFIDSRWCKDEMEKAITRHISNQDCVIPLLLEPLEDFELPLCLSNITYSDFTNFKNEKERVQELRKLKRAILTS